MICGNIRHKHIHFYYMSIRASVYKALLVDSWSDFSLYPVFNGYLLD